MKALRGGKKGKPELPTGEELDALGKPAFEKALARVEALEAEAKRPPAHPGRHQDVIETALAAMNMTVVEARAQLSVPPSNDVDVSERSYRAFRLVARLEADLDDLAAECRRKRGLIAYWQGKAEAAIRNDDDVTARRALARRNEEEGVLQALAQEHESGAAIARLLRRTLEETGLEPPQVH
ncbi:MAG: hypothetical protein HOV80_23815 [Polyangiaceae bacterium]|nr:hypothetical protein [Polyangiaceae bacterium]